MPKFHVRTTFERPDRDLFVLAGSIMEGEIRADMFIKVPMNTKIGINLLIESIEFARHERSEDMCLCIRAGPNFTAVLRGLQLCGQILEVSASHS